MERVGDIGGTTLPPISRIFRPPLLCPLDRTRLGGSRTAFMQEGERLRPGRVAGPQIPDPESSPRDKIGDRPIEMAAAGERSPDRCQPILKANNPGIRSLTVLDEQEIPVGLEYPSHFGERRLGRAGDADLLHR